LFILGISNFFEKDHKTKYFFLSRK